MMRDQFWLIVCALGCAAAAWAFWHYLDSHAVNVLALIAMVSVVADNLRLRRKLREAQRGA
jgi:hypothetical protein